MSNPAHLHQPSPHPAGPSVLDPGLIYYALCTCAALLLPQQHLPRPLPVIHCDVPLTLPQRSEVKYFTWVVLPALTIAEEIDKHGVFFDVEA